jgi:chromosome segregation protein
MLKRLELVGFKSFADRTRFDFAPGITGVVGPNGSGKSNVVDAVRWILGEQSAKSLRGGEMADVIFNGSSSRKSLGLAEVTVALDNTRRLLAVDSDEVELTRRVYRDGTGEYLINGEVARLKDFKEMFLGSGAGANGYTIIAQGRVDELLQASTKDRREIFDEAAGISRFKARKVETLRKLAAVEINLTRSKDRLETFETQLRTLKTQAAKAQKYRDYSDRLRDLRVGMGAREFHELTAALEAERLVLAELQTEVAGANRQAGELEESLRELDRAVTRAEDGLRHQEGRLADARQQIAGHESTLKHQRSAAADHEAELLRIGRQRAELGARTRIIEADAARAALEAAAAEEAFGAVQESADRAAAVLAEAAERVADLDRAIAADREQQFQLVGEAAAARSNAAASLAQVERLQKEYTRKLAEVEQSAARRAALADVLDGLSRADADVQARLAEARDRSRRLQSDRDDLAGRIGRVQESLESLRVRQGDLHGRVTVLEDLERAFDGLGAGVRHVLERVHEEREARAQRLQVGDVSAGGEPPPLCDILGLVADLLRVPHEIASQVELALGDAAQRFIVRSFDLEALAARVGDVPGRVGFIPYRESGVGGRESGVGTRDLSLASRVESELPGLPEQLLGNVLLADSLPDARRLHQTHPGCRVVTRAGELLEPDGTLTVGPPRTEAGLVSRKSELRELSEQLRAVTEQIAITTIELAELHRRADAADGTIEAVESEIELLSGESGDLQQKIARQLQQVEQLDETIELAQREGDLLAEEVRRGEADWVSAKLAAEEAERAEESLRTRLVESEAALRQAEQHREAAQEANTAAQVALSRAVAERDRARERVSALDIDLRKRRVEAVDLAATDRTTRARLAECTLALLNASSGQADAYREKEHREGLIAELVVKADADRARRERVRDELQALRAGWQERQAEAHAKELAVHDLDARREGIASRIREDYAIELASLPETGDRSQETGDRSQESGDRSQETGDSATLPPVSCLLSPEQAQEQIEELRRKLARLGSVNMEALEELGRVESEYESLRAQHEDLGAARKSLEDVIDAINADSRKLFTETLSTVRGHFQELFRKLFGGGQADVVLEEGMDVLEAGIEIIARPPGKELRALSLLSGGEKTLSAIALLLAIFRSKPSPFCILDEVDAALDEANTTRLAGVLREFLDQSQFIVVTHKKRTMAAADRLWGVTMQESGVTRLLPMRFEDWPDEEPPTGDEQAA